MDLFVFTPDNLTMFIVELILTVLFIVAAYFGSKLPWYQNLQNKSPDNVYILATAWFVASAISYGIFWVVEDKNKIVILLPWYVIISILNLLWVVIFYIYQSFISALFFILLIILINMYLILFLFTINIWAGILLVPLQILYIYLIYSLIHLASINNIVI